MKHKLQIQLFIIILSIITYTNSNEITIADDKFIEEAFLAHNEYRALHEDTKPLTLSKDLCTMAQDYANYLATNNLWLHSGNLYGRQWTGENLYQMWDSSNSRKITGKDMSKSWYEEIYDYDYSTGAPKNSGKMIGHFTQLIWADTEQVGFGAAKAPNENKWYGVATYYPGGNFNHQELTMVKKLKKKK